MSIGRMIICLLGTLYNPVLTSDYMPGWVLNVAL